MKRPFTSRSRPRAEWAHGALDAITAPQTYRNLLYLALSFPLGLAYFVGLTVAISLGAGLSVVGIGLAILVGALFAVRYLAAFERALANALLPVTLAAPADVATPSNAGPVETVRAYLGAESTWRGLAFCYLKLGLGTVAFVLLVVATVVPIALVTAPLHYQAAAIQLGPWHVDTLAEAILVVPVGVGAGVLGLLVCNAAAGVFATVAEALLDGPKSGARL